MTWKSGTWLVLDTETTGLLAGTDRIVELGMVLVLKQQVALVTGTLIDPGMLIPPEVTALHGIRNEDVAGKPKLADIASYLQSWLLRCDVVVGYNLPFDWRMLTAELGEMKSPPHIDPLVLVRHHDVGKYWRGKGRHKLEEAARRLDCLPPDIKLHRATDDCCVTAAILKHLLYLLPDDAIEANNQVARWHSQQNAEFGAWKAQHD